MARAWPGLRPLRALAVRLIVLPGLAALLGGCATRPAVQAEVARGSSDRRLVLVVRGRDGGHAVVRSLRITRMRKPGGGWRGIDDVSIWVVAPVGRRAAVLPTDSIRYGVAPPGFDATHAGPLLPGSYDLDVVDAAGVRERVWFLVARNGAVSDARRPAS